MNDVTISIYLICLVVLLGVTLTFMWKNMKSINKMLNNPMNVKSKLPHPELKDVQTGDELLVVDFKPDIRREGAVDIVFTPDKEFQDLYLKKSLEKRIEEIDDEDDGGLISRK
tara:strand:- start:830 stop:1168 length:339 start_codon:yes stop_codon:yes gene_type:complete